MNKASLLVVIPLFTSGIVCFSTEARSSATELEEATALMKQMHGDQCEQQHLRGQVMLAHRNHDEATVNELWPQVEAISKRLKPAEERMKTLKARIQQNPDEQNAFETALLQNAECE